MTPLICSTFTFTMNSEFVLERLIGIIINSFVLLILNLFKLIITLGLNLFTLIITFNLNFIVNPSPITILKLNLTLNTSLTPSLHLTLTHITTLNLTPNPIFQKIINNIRFRHSVHDKKYTSPYRLAMLTMLIAPLSSDNKCDLSSNTEHPPREYHNYFNVKYSISFRMSSISK